MQFFSANLVFFVERSLYLLIDIASENYAVTEKSYNFEDN